MACTYAAPGPFCSRMFAMWADAAPVLGIPFVMRDVTLWAFTTEFFADRPGEEDILIPVALSRELHKAIPGAQWQTVRGGHACLWEHPGSFNHAVLDFVRSQGKD
jgi:3-oxoadipate enol-lactonase